MTLEQAKRELRGLNENRGGAEVRRRIESLGQPHRNVLYYRYVKELSWKQVAEIMEYSTDHLRGYMNKRALEKYAEAAAVTSLSAS